MMIVSLSRHLVLLPELPQKPKPYKLKEKKPELFFFIPISLFSRQSMAQNELIDSNISLRQCQLAVEALHSHQTKVQEKQAESQLLLGKEQHVWLVLAVKKIHPEKNLKPFKMYVSLTT
jgi:hypothetical protein